MLVWFSIAGVAAVAWIWWRSQRRKQQMHFLQHYAFKRAYVQAIRPQFPQVAEGDFLLAEDALRQFFLMHLKAPHDTLYMPSRLADALWREFLLDAPRYEQFCAQAFGQWIHHKPSDAPQKSGTNLRRLHLRKTWNAAVASTAWMAPRKASIGGVPLLFALDAHARLTEGYIYDASDFAYWSRMMHLRIDNGGGGSGGDSASGNGRSAGGCGD